MKKIIALFLVLTFCLCFVACNKDDNGDESTASTADGGNASATDVSVNDGSSFGINLTAEGEQAMSDERASLEKLQETVNVWLEGNTMFKYSSDTRTYQDFVDYIGCEASAYMYSASKNERTYIWYVEGETTKRFNATFGEENGKWVLYATGSLNLG